MTEKKVDEIKISDQKTIDEIKAIQKYIKSKGGKATETEVIQVCIRLAKRLSAEDWGIYLEIKHVHDYKHKMKVL